MSKWSLGEPFVPALSESPIRFLLKGTAGDMNGIIYPSDSSSPPVWVPGDNSAPFTAKDLREIAGLLDEIWE